MYPFKFVLKYLVVMLFGIAGVLSLSRGFGLPIPFLKYGALEAWNVLAGAGLLAFSLCCAFFWHAPRRAETPEPILEPARRRSFTDEWVLQTEPNTLPPVFDRRSRVPSGVPRLH